MNKKIAVLSFSGKVGKSTLTNTLLYPKMPEGTKIFRIESINISGQSGSDDEKKMRGTALEKLQVELSKTQNAIIDIGASNVESLFLALSSQSDSHLDFDYFLVPVLANITRRDEMEEAIKTIQALAEMGVEPARIKVVFNMLPRETTIEDECALILNFHKKHPIFILNKEAVVHETDAFSALNKAGKSYMEMLADTNNYREELNKIPMENEKERSNMVKIIRAQGTVKVLSKEMDAVFNHLFSEA